MQYAYDANGNLLSDGVNTYAYDSANRLTSQTGPAGTISYAYRCNGLSRDAWGITGCNSDRVSQTVNGVTTYYTLDQAAGLTQVLDDGTNTYLYGNDRIAQINATGTEYFLGDALGSVRQMTDTAGAVALARAYDPFGVVSAASGSGATNYGFTGEFQSQEGIYLRARTYLPSTGRFFTRDIWAGNANQPMSYNAWLYGYANPVNYTDPTGNVVCFPGAIGSVLVGTHSFTVGTAIELCKLQYSKTWGLQLYPDNNGITECPQNDLWAKPNTVTGLYIDWLCERGPENVSFYGRDPLTQELARSAVVASIRLKYYKDRNSSPQTLDFGATAFAEATLDSFINQRISITHFMGSFDYKIKPLSNSRLSFWISNDTERASGSHFIMRFKDKYQGSLEELVNLHPELLGGVVETVISQYNVISVLKAKTRTETTGDEGGGKMNQTFTWSENYLDCSDSIWPLYLQFLDIRN